MLAARSQFALTVPAVTLLTVRSLMCASSIRRAVALAEVDAVDLFPAWSTAITFTWRAVVASTGKVPTAGTNARIMPTFAGSFPTRVEVSGVNPLDAPTWISRWFKSTSKL